MLRHCRKAARRKTNSNELRVTPRRSVEIGKKVLSGKMLADNREGPNTHVKKSKPITPLH